MNLIKPFIVVLVLFFVCIPDLPAQQVNGHWFGVGKVAVPGEHSAYMAEMVLKQKGKKITGQLHYYFRDSLFTVPVNGLFNSSNRQLNLQPVPFIYYLSGNTKTGIDCFLAGKFTLIINRTESILNGAFETDAAHRYTAPAIQFRFRLSTDTMPAIMHPDELTEAGEISRDTADTIIDTLSAQAVVPKATVDTVFTAREKVFIREIEVSGGPLQIQLYDNGSIDYDSVSLYLNQRLLIPKVKLDHRAIRKTILLDSTLAYNELSMFAENLGMVPPNTAALIIYDGDKRHELILTSDLNKTATIRLRNRRTANIQ